jgi:hypothetical protein
VRPPVASQPPAVGAALPMLCSPRPPPATRATQARPPARSQAFSITVKRAITRTSFDHSSEILACFSLLSRCYSCFFSLLPRGRSARERESEVVREGAPQYGDVSTSASSRPRRAAGAAGRPTGAHRPAEAHRSTRNLSFLRPAEAARPSARPEAPSFVLAFMEGGRVVGHRLSSFSRVGRSR